MFEALVAIVCALVVGGLCFLAPSLIRRLPEPETEAAAAPVSADPGDDAVGADMADTADTADGASPMSGVKGLTPKVAYATLAARPRLGQRLAICGAAAGLIVGLRLAGQPILFAWLFLSMTGVVLGYVDAQTRLLPTRIIAPSYVVLVVLILVSALIDGESIDLRRACLGWLVYGGFYFLMWFIYPRGLGYGDVRLSGLLGLALGYLGWGEVLVGMYAGFLLGGVIGGLLALGKVVDRKRYPFGPFMLMGALVGLLWGTPVADWYAAR